MEVGRKGHERARRIDYTRETYMIVGRVEGKVDALKCEECFNRLTKVETWQDRVSTVSRFIGKVTAGGIAAAGAIWGIIRQNQQQ